jgi:hypothetical protein
VGMEAMGRKGTEAVGAGAGIEFTRAAVLDEEGVEKRTRLGRGASTSASASTEVEAAASGEDKLDVDDESTSIQRPCTQEPSLTSHFHGHDSHCRTPRRMG